MREKLQKVIMVETKVEGGFKVQSEWEVGGFDSSSDSQGVNDTQHTCARTLPSVTLHSLCVTKFC